MNYLMREKYEYLIYSFERQYNYNISVLDISDTILSIQPNESDYYFFIIQETSKFLYIEARFEHLGKLFIEQYCIELDKVSEDSQSSIASNLFFDFSGKCMDFQLNSNPFS